MRIEELKKIVKIGDVVKVVFYKGSAVMGMVTGISTDGFLYVAVNNHVSGIPIGKIFYVRILYKRESGD